MIIIISTLRGLGPWTHQHITQCRSLYLCWRPKLSWVGPMVVRAPLHSLTGRGGRGRKIGSMMSNPKIALISTHALGVHIWWLYVVVSFYGYLANSGCLHNPYFVQFLRQLVGTDHGWWMFVIITCDHQHMVPVQADLSDAVWRSWCEPRPQVVSLEADWQVLR